MNVYANDHDRSARMPVREINSVERKRSSPEPAKKAEVLKAALYMPPQVAKEVNASSLMPTLRKS